MAKTLTQRIDDLHRRVSDIEGAAKKDANMVRLVATDAVSFWDMDPRAVLAIFAIGLLLGVVIGHEL